MIRFFKSRRLFSFPLVTISAPSLNQPCQTKCQVPLVCRGPRANSKSTTTESTPESENENATTVESTPASENDDENTTLTDSQPGGADKAHIYPPPPYPKPRPTGKICRCEPPYILEDGDTCTLGTTLLLHGHYLVRKTKLWRFPILNSRAICSRKLDLKCLHSFADDTENSAC